MNTRTQMWCLWCGPAAILLFTIGYWPMAGLMPPPSPHDSAAEILSTYRDHHDLVHAGLVLVMVAGAMTGPWVAAISTQMKRVEGQYSPLAYTNLGLGMIGILLFIIPAMLWQAEAFRATRDPDTLLFVNDIAWLMFVGVFSPAFFQGLAIAICAFKDTEEKVFKRWVGYFNVWVVLLFVPGSLIYFFKSGAFAWNGVFCFWLPLSVFFAWFVVMFFVLRDAIKRQEAEEAAATP